MDETKSPIEMALFALEAVAHLQGRERELLPIVEEAREEYKQIKEVTSE